MKGQWWLLFLVSSVLITGCMPFLVHDYYSPDASEGTIKKSTCYETSGPPDTIEFKRYDVTINVIVSEGETGFHVFVRLRIPKGKEVKLESPTVTISTPANAIHADGSFSVERFIAEAPWQIKSETDEPMIGDTKESNMSFFGPRTYDSYYTMNADVTIQKSDAIVVKMPILNVNEVKVELPEIRFKKDRFLELFAPINC